MPVEVKAWTCKWKCGRKSTTHYWDIERHEKWCYRNPANRACVICAHFQKRTEDDGAGCGKGIDLYDAATDRTTLRHDCEQWDAGKGKV